MVFSDREGHRISAVLDRPTSDSTKGVVLCHGLFGFKDSVTNRAISRLLNERGFTTLRFDFFGHGASEGTLQDLLLTILVGQTEAALDVMRAEGIVDVGLLGSSFGGLVAVLVAARAVAQGAGSTMSVSGFAGTAASTVRPSGGRTVAAYWHGPALDRKCPVP